MLEENNVRQGFFEDWELAALLEHLPEYLRGMTVFAYRTGWRVSELTDLKWSQIDRDEGYARLEVGTTKNKAGRTVVLDDVLRDVIERQWSTRIGNGILIPYVFPNRIGTDKIKDFRYVWGKACEKARIGKKYFHDFRRSAVRNLTRAGVPQRLAQEITGHKTRSVFERYNIISEADLRLAAERQAAYLKEKAARTSTKTRTILDFPTKKGLANKSQALSYHVPRAGIEPARGSLPEGF